MGEQETLMVASRTDGTSGVAINEKTEMLRMKEWFSNLAGVERSNAVGFVDGPFLATFLKLSSSLESDAGKKEGGPDLDEIFTRVLCQSVSIETVEETFMEFEKMCQADKSTMSKTPRNEEEQLTSSSPDTKVSGSPDSATEQESSVVKSSTSDSSKVVTLNQSGEAGTSAETNDPPNDKSEVVEESVVSQKPVHVAVGSSDFAISSELREIIENVCVVFPSVLEMGGESTCNQRFPFVTLQPAFLEKFDDERLLTAMQKSGYPSFSFLSEEALRECMGSDKKHPWLMRLASLNPTPSDGEARVPLFLLLFTRLELAVFVAYQAAQAKRRNACDRTDEEPVPEGKISDMEVNSKPAGDSAEMMQHLLSEIVSQTGKANSLVSSDPLVLRGMVSPILRLGLIDEEVISSNSLTESLLMTPLQWLLKGSTAAGSSPTTLREWDSAWKDTLAQLKLSLKGDAGEGSPAEVLNPSVSTPVKGSDRAQDSKLDEHKNPEWMDDNSPSTQVTNQKKSGKKRRRRKNKRNKNSNNNQGGDSSAVAAASVGTPPSSSATNAATSQQNSTKVEANESSIAQPVVAVEEPATSSPPEPVPVIETETPSETDKTLSTNADESKKITVSHDIIDDTEKLISSEETASTRSDSTKHEDTENEVNTSTTRTGSDITVSRVEGLGTVVVAPSAVDPPKEPAGKSNSSGNDKKGEAVDAVDDSHLWATVEARGRGNRKKTGDRSGQNRFSGSSGQPQQNSGGSKKPKSSRTSASRKRVANRKIVREIILSILDTVDERVVKRKRQEARAVPMPPLNSSTAKNVSEAPKKETTTMLDVVLGRSPSAVSKNVPQSSSTSNDVVDSKQRGTGKTEQKGPDVQGRDTVESVSPVKRTKGPTASGADQNTAPTVPETVSAMSITNSAVVDSRREAPSGEQDVLRSDSSSTGVEARKQDRPGASSHTGKQASPAPPLPTLLSPTYVNSSSSSVASSLEAPHAGHRSHHATNENDVGYHLLDVCDRLSKDMHVFMSRRAQALTARRRERESLLTALQESVSLLWSSKTRVELYGSCATQLDLPSSDLDVVVCGVDRSMDVGMVASPMSQKNLVNFNGSPSDGHVIDKMGADTQHSRHHMHMPHYVYPVRVNADRVVRLGAELERQPWAVHVKAIPTASVPVVKVLADPTRLPGATASQREGEEWIVQRHQMASQPGLAGTASPMSPPTWRGADVMNGLLSLDITFEGAGHGGIGSTEFSSRVVHEACAETNNSAENTPLVQVVMVLKELLAQRRLNEPFSGGLSSYALLLLVLAVLRERRVIREELERVELQRRVVAAGGGNSGFSVTSCDDTPPAPVKKEKVNHHKEKVESTESVSQSKVPSLVTTAPSSKKQTKPHQSGQSKVAKSMEVVEEKATTEKSSPKAWKPVPKAPEGNVASTTPTPKAAPVASSRGHAQEKKAAGSSWANIARGVSDTKKAPTAAIQHGAAAEKKGKQQQQQHKGHAPAKKRPGTFADAVARSTAAAVTTARPPIVTANVAEGNKGNKKRSGATAKNEDKGVNKESQKVSQQISNKKNLDKGIENNPLTPPPQQQPKQQHHHRNKKEPTDEANVQKKREEGGRSGSGRRKTESDEQTSKFNNFSTQLDSNYLGANSQSQFPPQGFNDVIEVLCSGETTTGKLLMHFLLFYGQYFDAQATSIDISGKHFREMGPSYTYMSPYIQRRQAGVIDPITGMLTVDPIVVYDPLEGAENNNVARRCFLWSNVRWVFAQSYMTLLNAVERSSTPPSTPSGKHHGMNVDEANSNSNSGNNNKANHNHTAGGGNTGTNANHWRRGENSASSSGAANPTWNGPYKQGDRGGLINPSSPLLELLLSF